MQTPLDQRVSFSSQIPNLQLAWDSTSIGTLKECPRKYQLSILLGWLPRVQALPLTFGILYHEALELYDILVVRDGLTHAAAIEAVVRNLLTKTWDKKNDAPWKTGDKYRNRYTLLRAVVWYLESLGENNPFPPIILSNGSPAVELSFRWETEIPCTLEGGNYMLCGHLDKLARYAQQLWVVDRKTTQATVNTRYFTRFNPDNQMSTYSFASKFIFDTPVAGVVIDAVQTAVNFSEYTFGFAMRAPGHLAEWYEGLRWWLRQNERYVEDNYWPMNDKACFLCEFKSICGRTPSVRDNFLRTHFIQTKGWDPLEPRTAEEAT